MKFLSKLFTLIMACMLCFGLVACGGNSSTDSTSDTNSTVTAPATAYTVYAKDESGNPIANVEIGICTYNETTGVKGNCLRPVTTDADGKVVLQETEGVYIVNEGLFEADYEATAHCILKAYGEYTIVLRAI